MLLTVHALLYLAVNVLLVLLWLMLGGDWGGAANPLAAAREAGFCPSGSRRPGASCSPCTQGDGFLVTFGAPRQAAACAVAFQRRLAEERDDADRVPHVRIGLHAGEVQARDGDVVAVDDLGLRALDGQPTPRHLLALRWQR